MGTAMERLLNTSGAAKILAVVPDTVRLWERTGRLPALRTESGMRLFRRQDVEALAARRAQEHSSDAKAPD